jgi:hypothetical protein
MPIPTRASTSALGGYVTGHGELCPPLFPLTHCAKGGITAATRRPCSR